MGRNVALTHSLFSTQKLTPGFYSLIQAHSYTLILDEVLDVVSPVEIADADMLMLFDTEKIVVNDDGFVQWKDSDYKGEFTHLKRQAENRSLIWYNQKIFLWLFPIEMLRAFEEAYILTFLFHGSHMKYYLDIHQLEYTIHHVEAGCLKSGKQDVGLITQRLTPLIEIYDGNLNGIGNDGTVLSASWYKKHRRDGMAKTVTQNASNYFRHKCVAKSAETLWTCFQDISRRFPVRDYQGGFCPCNARATNEYRARRNLAYLINVYDHPYVIGWFRDHGIKVDQDAFALSQLLQWIWRSAIRDGNPITIYIPSSRMRRLLEDWLTQSPRGK